MNPVLSEARDVGGTKVCPQTLEEMKSKHEPNGSKVGLARPRLGLAVCQVPRRKVARLGLDACHRPQGASSASKSPICIACVNAGFPRIGS